MTDTEKLCMILRQRNPELKCAELARKVGVVASTLAKAFAGRIASPKLADWMAANYRGVCKELRDNIYTQKNKNLGNGEFRRIRHYDYVVLETHKLVPIDHDNILATLLPVTHPGGFMYD